jgi:hypothetical protein
MLSDQEFHREVEPILKCYTLVMIVNPACYEQLCNYYKLECQKNKTKRISLAQIS